MKTLDIQEQIHSKSTKNTWHTRTLFFVVVNTKETIVLALKLNQGPTIPYYLRPKMVDQLKLAIEIHPSQ